MILHIIQKAPTRYDDFIRCNVIEHFNQRDVTQVRGQVICRFTADIAAANDDDIRPCIDFACQYIVGRDDDCFIAARQLFRNNRRRPIGADDDIRVVSFDQFRCGLVSKMT